MELRIEQPGLAQLLEDGRVLAELRATGTDEAGFAALVARLRAALDPAPARVVVTYREGLLAEVQADAALDLLFVEEDPHDTPPVQLRRRQVAADAEGLRRAMAQAEKAGSRTPGR